MDMLNGHSTLPGYFLDDPWNFWTVFPEKVDPINCPSNIHRVNPNGVWRHKLRVEGVQTTYSGKWPKIGKCGMV